MSAEDYMPADYGDEGRYYGWLPRTRRFSCAGRTVPTCRHCGEFCRWGLFAGQWRLATFEGALHICASRLPTPDDFEVES